MLSKVLKNKVFFYLMSRYFVYFVQFITSILIAVKLGPYYFGIWGFVVLVLNFFSKLNFGVVHSFNVLYVQNIKDKNVCGKYVWNAILLSFTLSLLVVLFYLLNLVANFEIIEKYHSSKYIFAICIIGALYYYVMLFVGILRVNNKLIHVAFCQSIVVILFFLCVLSFSGKLLIESLIISYVVGYAMCIGCVMMSGVLPSVNSFSVDICVIKELLSKGFFLFLYNSCFYYIIFSVRSLVSWKYDVEEFGLFSFSFSLAHAVLLLFEALTFAIYPKVIKKLSSDNIEEAKQTVSLLRKAYIPSANLLVYTALFLFPLFAMLVSQYTKALISLNLIALSILMNANSYGYSELLVARNRERTLASFAIMALFFNLGIALFLVLVLKISFSYVIFATMLTYFIFSFSLSYIGKKILHCVNDDISLFSTNKLIPYFLAIVLTLFQCHYLMFIPLIIFIALNNQEIMELKYTVKTIISKPEAANV